MKSFLHPSSYINSFCPDFIFHPQPSLGEEKVSSLQITSQVLAPHHFIGNTTLPVVSLVSVL